MTIALLAGAGVSGATAAPRRGVSYRLDMSGSSRRFGRTICTSVDLPLVLLAVGWIWGLPGPASGMAAAATVRMYLPRLLALRRFRQPIVGAILHPVGVLVSPAIQWSAFTRPIVGRPATWKGRPCPARDVSAPLSSSSPYNV
jgi:hypothetical protein